MKVARIFIAIMLLRTAHGLTDLSIWVLPKLKGWSK